VLRTLREARSRRADELQWTVKQSEADGDIDRLKEAPMAKCSYCAKELTGSQPVCPDHLHLWLKEPRQSTSRSWVSSRSSAKPQSSRSLGRRGGRGR
jgi:hypothetical protein